jgi:hypothetical protein
MTLAVQVIGQIRNHNLILKSYRVETALCDHFGPVKNDNINRMLTITNDRVTAIFIELVIIDVEYS